VVETQEIGTYGIHFRGFLPLLVLSAGKREYFPALAGLVGWFKRIFSCLGWSSRSGTREYFPALAGLVGRFKRIFSCLGWSSGSVQEIIFPSGLKCPPPSTEPVFLNVYGAPELIPRNKFRQPM
jgi:hypothetical protein